MYDLSNLGSVLFLITIFVMEPKVVEADTAALPTPASALPRDIGHDNRVFADETGLPHLTNGKRHQPEALRNFENSKL